MHGELQRVLELQPSWSSSNMPAMLERGRIIRDQATGWLREHEGDLAAAIGIPADDLLTEGRDGTGRKTRVPWVRFGSDERSPSATEGFYVVYLWAFDGSAVYLSLNQGTTDFVNGEFAPKDPAVLAARVSWGRSIVAPWIAARSDIVAPSLGDRGLRSLGHGYELGDVASIRYTVNSIPDDAVLLADAVAFGTALGELYRAHSKEPLPFEVPELVAIEDAAEDAAGKKRPRRGAGFRQNAEERQLIENHAVDVAEAYYRREGWRVKRRGAPYDLDLVRDAEKMSVEVKGTTSMGEAVPLTRGEVEYQAGAHPNNAFVVVRGIVLDRSTSPPTVSGGVLFEQQPWSVDADALTVISYKYTVPPALYDGNGIDAETLLK